jgi:hypothetical protein
MKLATLEEQTLRSREAVAALARRHLNRADEIPAGWNNNLRWHVGHLVVTPHRLTRRLLGEALPFPDDYTGWFAKGSSPASWAGASIPSLEVLIERMLQDVAPLFRDFRDRLDQPFASPLETSVGIVLRTPEDGLVMNLLHDGIHLGMMIALIRALDR